MKIDMISDLHGCKPALHGGDILIIAGDLTAHDKKNEYYEFARWLNSQPYRDKILIAGNHDNKLNGYEIAELGEAIYLEDRYIELQGILIYGSPWSLRFRGINPHCTAFTCTEEDMRRHYAKIPWATDILITHEPPYGILDYRELEDGTNYHMGSHSLLQASSNVKPALHVFGHIHECGGKIEKNEGTIYANASVMTELYDETGTVVSVEI